MISRRALLAALGGASVPMLLTPASIQARQFTTNGRPSEINLTPSGGNDSPQIQSAIDKLVATEGGDVVLNSNGGWRLDQTVFLPRNTAPSRVVNLIGLGRPVISGSANPLIRVEGMWGYRLSGFDLAGSGRTKTGIWFAKETGSGTQGGQAVVERVNAGGFDIGFRFGEATAGIATSEIVLINCKAADCNTGFQVEDYNTLDLTFVMLNLGENRIGVNIVNGGSVNVFGGSASNSTYADFQQLSAQMFSATGFRSEGANRAFVQLGYSAVTPVTFTACDLHTSSNPDRILIYAKGGGHLNLDGSRVFGKVVYENNSYAGSVTMKASAIGDTVPFSVPHFGDIPYSTMGVTLVTDSGDLIQSWPNGGGKAGPGGIRQTWGDL